MNILRPVAAFLVAAVIGAVASQYIMTYVHNHEKTPENCIRQVREHYAKDLVGLNRTEDAEVTMAFFAACADAGNDYEQALVELAKIQGNH